jgi:signal transduction histidine kinase
MSDLVAGLLTYTRSPLVNGEFSLPIAYSSHKEQQLLIDTGMFRDAIDREALEGLIQSGSILVEDRPGLKNVAFKTGTRLSDLEPNSRLVPAVDNSESALQSSWELFSLFAHQLLTYMTYIELTVDALKYSEQPALQTDTQEENLEFIRDQVNHAADVLKSGLNLVRVLQRGSLQLEPIALSPLIRLIVNRFKAQFADREITVTSAVDGIIFGNQLLTELIIENLVQNALVHSGDQTSISITVEEQDEVIVVNVIDNGCGIPEIQLKELFTPSERANPAAKRRSQGLGLFLTKMAVELQEGQISVESQLAKGTAFSISLKKCAAFATK